MQYYNVCYHSKANCTEIDFRLGCWGAYIAPQTQQLYLRGLFLRGWREKGRRLAGEWRTEGGAREKCEAQGPQGS